MLPAPEDAIEDAMQAWIAGNLGGVTVRKWASEDPSKLPLVIVECKSLVPLTGGAVKVQSQEDYIMRASIGITIRCQAENSELPNISAQVHFAMKRQDMESDIVTIHGSIFNSSQKQNFRSNERSRTITYDVVFNLK